MHRAGQKYTHEFSGGHDHAMCIQNHTIPAAQLIIYKKDAHGNLQGIGVLNILQ
jgi:hypothetical protein